MGEADLLAAGRQTLPDVLGHAATQRSDACFLCEPTGTALTYGEALEEILAIARGLRSLDVGGGDRVHLNLPNRVSFVVHVLALATLGAVAVPTNPESSSDELAYVLSHAGCVVSVSSEGGRPAIEETRDLCPEVRHVLGPTDLALLGREGSAPGWAQVAPLDPAAILYTSGTTGWPKGVVVTHANLVMAGEVVAGHLRMWPDDRWLVTLPLFHGNALFYSTMSALVTGASLIVADGLDPDAWVAQARQHEATLASFFAAGVRQVLHAPASDEDRDHRLRAALFAQHLTESQLAGFEARFGVPLLQLYGMTETVAPVLMNPLYGQRRNTTLGRPVLGYPLRIVTDDGREARPGDHGELLVEGLPGVTLMAGYHNAPELTAAAYEDGWFRTGDHVQLESDGYVRFLDRGTDILKPAVENISTGEIERVLREHPSVIDAAVVGVTDIGGEERVVAFVMVRSGDDATSDELVELCRDRLAPFKVPSEVRLVDDLPRSAVGKIQKHLLKETTCDS